MTGRLRRFALVALVPTLVDVGLLVVFRQRLGWILVLADLAAIAVASVLSYALHRSVTFRSDPYVRWVEIPPAFVGVAAVAAAVDVVVLRGLYAGTGFASTAALVEAKAVALLAAGAVRLAGYRLALLGGMTWARRVRWARPEPPGDVRLSVVVPAYDEVDRIGATIRRLRDGLAPVAAGGGLEVVVVDDGSADATADAALAAGADQVVVQPVNRGKGAAVRSGMLAARGRTVAFTDADLAYGPEQVLRVLEAVEGGWDVAIGDRRHPDTRTLVAPSRLRRWGSRAINWLGYAVLLGSYRDTQSGLKGFRSDVARFVFARCRVDGFAFDVEVLHLVERHHLSLVEVPVDVTNSARSTVHAARDALRQAADLFRIRHWSAEGAYEAGDDLPPVLPAGSPAVPGAEGATR
ncbi:MAG TPA: glycosyltransferase [Acidimicrobiales bacterium]|nr:glycosyltransferase [Acidimicrobiales bacterium]